MEVTFKKHNAISDPFIEINMKYEFKSTNEYFDFMVAKDENARFKWTNINVEKKKEDCKLFFYKNRFADERDNCIFVDKTDTIRLYNVNQISYYVKKITQYINFRDEETNLYFPISIPEGIFTVFLDDDNLIWKHKGEVIPFPSLLYLLTMEQIKLILTWIKPKIKPDDNDKLFFYRLLDVEIKDDEKKKEGELLLYRKFDSLGPEIQAELVQLISRAVQGDPLDDLKPKPIPKERKANPTGKATSIRSCCGIEYDADCKYCETCGKKLKRGSKNVK